jgi:hypothetical protein
VIALGAAGRAARLVTLTVTVAVITCLAQAALTRLRGLALNRALAA